MNKLDVLVQKAISKHGITEITQPINPHRRFLTWKLEIEHATEFGDYRFAVWHHSTQVQHIGYLSQEYSVEFLQSMYGKKKDQIDILLEELGD